ncbi:ribosome biogenesis GTPase YlqF [Mycoplasmopsis fermentans]|uniref:Ribosome biogenesis GTPase A n=2 Tax=Mycoplasmopsis fermentans TaxID=2115 RepID=C4XE93_MYCFP|nr:ribosome biogenesis GTPase YlqF [Mycoplasmopsis fermentans]VEU67659.1 GTPase [Mesomycoplasma conjunctivae]ADN68751.1 predicted GTP-binding protein [Mycoplasmopsis fermentans JER]ADV34162.1 GTP-binding protein [Mycoplasmopsis fermentans M64]RMX36297.1 ribosome biogenesis GTP-binding protein YlqF [Mycoplasmopsis fermentans MF-I2]RMX36375.1 ribosome biogenesis GTP-binding protein YlqF [Mycoplasmopsis fermentans MF-I1]
MNNNEQTLINWYPGHMAKAMREIKENATLADIFLIVLDARIPISSYNEDFDNIAPQKPRLFVITKSDLMDKSKKEKIQKRFQNEKLLWLDLRQLKSRNQILNQLKVLSQSKIKKDKEKGFLTSNIKVFVLGVPNAGKSTLINLMSQRKSLKVANYPGVTRVKKWVISDNFYFMDTPGILLPKHEDQSAAIKLAMIGSIETNIFPQRFLAENFLKVIVKYYPNKIKEEFNIDIESKDDLSETEAYNIVAQIADNKNFKVDKKIDFDRTYKYILNWIKNLKNVTFD